MNISLMYCIYLRELVDEVNLFQIWAPWQWVFGTPVGDSTVRLLL